MVCFAEVILLPIVNVARQVYKRGDRPYAKLPHLLVTTQVKRELPNIPGISKSASVAAIASSPSIANRISAIVLICIDLYR